MFYKFYNKPGAPGAGIKVGACKAPCYSAASRAVWPGNSPTHCQKHEIEGDIFCTKGCYRQLEYILESP